MEVVLLDLEQVDALNDRRALVERDGDADWWSMQYKGRVNIARARKSEPR